MADQFQNPASQADLQSLRAALEKLDAEVVGMKDQLSAELAAVREAERAQQATRRAGGAAGSRSTASAVPSLRAEVEAIDAQVISYEKLNTLIARRIELEAEAAGAARGTAGAAGAPLVAGAPGSQWASERERIMSIAAMGSAPAAAGAAGAQAATASRASVALNELSGSQERAAASARMLAVSELDARESLAAASLTAQEFDTKLASTGALSSTALAALGNGTITLRDLGHQVTETIGKFGGWTLAAGAVYGVLGGLNEVRQGVIDTSSTLTGLTKFLPPGHFNEDKARQQLVQQAQATATPLGDVGDTAQQFAKAFKSQTDVFTATHVALTAAKLDNIQLADSYKYLTAIVQETGMSVSDLPHLFDQITAAQDKLGARVSQLLPAYAGSIGAVQTAHGDPNQLLGLEALTLVRTGRSGSQVATGYARGATNFFPTAASRGILSHYGIDPNQGFTAALIDAITTAQKEHLAEPVKRQLSQAFFGPLRGSMFTNLFNTPLSGQRGLDNFLAQTAPGAHPDLANQQLAKTLQQPNSQLQLLKVNLQAIGAELSGSSFTSPFGLMLKGVNDMLEYSTKLMAVWDSLPSAFKTSASYLALAAAAMAGMRRFNIGATMAQSESPILRFVSPAFTRSPEAQLKSQVSAAMTGLGTNLDQQIAGASQRYVASTVELTRAQDQLAALQQQGLAETEAYNAALARAEVAQDAMTAATTEIAELQAVRAPASMAAIRSTMLSGPAKGAGAVGEAGQLALFGSLPGEAEVAAEETSKLSTAVALAGSGMAFLASNAIPLAIGAFLAFALIKQESQATHGAEIGAINQLQNAKTPAQVRAAVSAYYGAGTIPTPFGNISNIPSAQGDPSMHAAARAQLGYIKGLHDEQNAAINAYIQAQGDEMHGNFKAAYHRMQTDKAFQALGSIPMTTPFGATYNVPYAQALKQALIGYEGKSVGGKVNPFLMWEQAGQDPTNQLVPLMQGLGDAANVYGTKGPNIQKLAAGYAYTVEKFGRDPGNVKYMQALTQAQGELVTGVDKQVTDLTNMAQMSGTNKGQAGYYQQALSAVGRAEQQIRSMFGAAEKLPGANVGQLKQAMNQLLGLVAQKRQQAIDGILAVAKAQADLATSRIGGVGPGADLARAQSELTGLQGQLAKAKSIGANATTIDQLQQSVNQQAVTVLQDRINYWTQLAQANIGVATGQTADPVKQAEIQINILTSLLARLKSMGADQTTIKGVQGQIEQLGLTAESGSISQQSAVMQTQLSAQNIGQPQQVVLQNNLAEAKKFLAWLQTQPAAKVDPTVMQEAIKAVNDANGALAQWLIQEGANLIAANAALAESKTFDPVAIAEDELQKARKILAYDLAHNAPASQIASDRATIGNDIKSKLEAKWQRAEQTIQFLASTFQITGAQEIIRLKALLAQMKKDNASYADIQRVRQEIYNLEYGGGDLNLNTGSIHLPSTYEVKAALQRGKQVTRRKTAAGFMADVHTDVKMTINVHRDADIRKVAKAISDALGTSVHGTMQAAGLMD